jgi:hypothetical protein
LKIISKEEGENWLQGRSLPTDGGILRKYYKNSTVYQYIQTPGKIIGLSKFVADYFFQNAEEGALWITDWSFSYENMNLFTKFRKGLNEERTIQQAPFHIFDKNDRDDLESMMDLVMFNTWDTYLILPNRGIVFSPNDELLHVSCKEEVDLKEFKEFFKHYGFKKIKPT